MINYYAYAFFALAPVVMIAASLTRREWVFVLAIVVSLIGTYVLCNLAVHREWDIRAETAFTDEQREAASQDGANKVFAAILIGPVSAITFTAFWGWVGWSLGGLICRDGRSTAGRHAANRARQPDTQPARAAHD